MGTRDFSEEDIRLVNELRDNLALYAPLQLKVRDKAGKVVPFILNRAQRYLHHRLEEQLKALGRVRALVLKGRQQGASTYVEARFFHKTSLNFGLRAHILTHLDKSTKAIFEMAEVFHRELDPAFKPPLAKSNANELRFDGLDSGYGVSTAGTKGTGRGGTVQLFHGSEVAFWPNAKTHMEGIKQSIAEIDDTEVILETTANGYDEVFHPLWVKAEAGESDFIAIFLPWFLDDGYQRPVPAGYTFSAADLEYQDLHGITREQLYWRRRKIDDDFDGDELRFDQEYPGTAASAFVSFQDSYIAPLDVLRARKTIIEQPIGPMIWGLDPARFGDDSTALAKRRGRKVSEVLRWHKLNTMEVANRIARMIDDERPDRVFIDIVGLGAGVYDRLMELEFGHVVTGVQAGEKASDPERFFNKKAEMWADMKAWLERRPCQIPDRDDIQGDITAPKYDYKQGQLLQIESKENMRKRGARSPDSADAIALTFAYPVAVLAEEDREKRDLRRRERRRKSGWRLN